jgi:membrane associated rhomboid family serine protease
MFPLQDTNPSRSVPVVTWFLVLANVIVFFFELSMDPHELNAFIHMFGVVPKQFLADPNIFELITIFSAMFMHGGWMHLIGNMWALLIFGDNVEDRVGHVRYLLFYLVCGTIAALTHIYLGSMPSAPMIGASGAVAGVLGAYAVLFPGAKVMTVIPIGFIPFFLQIPAYYYLGIWFLMNLLPGLLSLPSTAAERAGENIAVLAHVGGFVAGALLVKLVERRDYQRWHPDEYRPY